MAFPLPSGVERVVDGECGRTSLEMGVHVPFGSARFWEVAGSVVREGVSLRVFLNRLRLGGADEADGFSPSLKSQVVQYVNARSRGTRTRALARLWDAFASVCG